MSPMWGGRRRGRVVRAACLRGGGPHPPAISLSRGTEVRVQRSPAATRSVVAHFSRFSLFALYAEHHRDQTCTIASTETFLSNMKMAVYCFGGFFSVLVKVFLIYLYTVPKSLHKHGNKCQCGRGTKTVCEIRKEDYEVRCTL